MRVINIDLANLLPVYECGNCGEANAAKITVDVSSISDNADFFVFVFKNAYSEMFCSEKFEASKEKNDIEITLNQQLTKTPSEIMVIEAYSIDENNEIVLLRKSSVINLLFDSSLSSDKAIEFDKELFGLYKELFDKTNELNSGLDILNKQITVVNAASEEANESAETALTAADNANNVAASLIESKNNGEFNGPQGEKGEKGDTGATGAQGEKGDAGPQGPAGEDGKAASINIGKVTTGAPGSQASVTNTGTDSAAVFDFLIPQGDKGDTGATGPQGEKGDTGPKGDKGEDYSLTEDDKLEIADIVEKMSGKKLTTFICFSLEELYQAAEDITANLANYSPLLLIPMFEDKENDIEYGCGQIIVDPNGSGSIDSSIVLPLCYVEEPYTWEKDKALETCDTFVQLFESYSLYRMLDKPEEVKYSSVSYIEYSKISGQAFSTSPLKYFIFDMNVSPDNSYIKGTVTLRINDSFCTLDFNSIYSSGLPVSLYLEIVFTIGGLIFINGTAKSSMGELAIHKNIGGNGVSHATKIAIEKSATVNQAYGRRY